MNKSPVNSKESGFSLVELMIAMVIGLLLLGGILQILLGNRESFVAQRLQADLQQNSRLAGYMLGSTLGHTGYYLDGFKDEKDIFGADPVISGTEGGNATTPDTLRIRFQAVSLPNQASGRAYDCLGREVTDESTDEKIRTADDLPEITDFEYSIVDGVLRCDVFTDAAPAQPLIENVENMQIEYGVDSNGDGSVDRYQNAAAANFERVKSVRVQLLIATAGNVRTESSTQTFKFLNGDVTRTDRRQYQLVEQLIALRNRLN